MNLPFYDRLAPYYHLIYENWEHSIDVQGKAIAHLLDDLGVARGAAVLDAACGIGTQALGLAPHYRLSASDLSNGAVARLDRELAQRGLTARTGVDDMRVLVQCASASMDAIIACDNSVPHLLTDADILAAFKTFFRCLRPNGVVLISVRDYANIARVSPDVRPYGMRYEGPNRFLAVQAWEWNGAHYDLRMYLTRENGDGQCETTCLRTRYYAVTIEQLCHLLHAAGFVDVARHDDVLFQPVLAARRPAV